MKRILLLLTIISFSFSCDSRRGFDIPDVSKPYEQVIYSKERSPSNVRIDIKGDINGDFTLNELNFDKGKIDTTLLLDQYSDSLRIKYTPSNVTSGQLRIDYLF
ncbi:MAG: hypothetical protein KA713_01515 [Chryseotalea sp. WA131a]|jgi:hypothetical protein|nr:MAG: hypothetical protein KA713_01515 [Chryseotalea sp. WA131a]